MSITKILTTSLQEIGHTIAGEVTKSNARPQSQAPLHIATRHQCHHHRALQLFGLSWGMEVLLGLGARSGADRVWSGRLERARRL